MDKNIDSNVEWTKQQEVAMNVFADFMANIIEKYGPLIDEHICKENTNKGECDGTCSLVRLFIFLLTKQFDQLYNNGGMAITRRRCI